MDDCMCCPLSPSNSEDRVMAYTKEQQRAYNLKRREERRKKCIELLGGKCVNCGATENLEFDHINPADTVRRISELLTCKMEILLGELFKCQLLCKPCHFEKTTRQDRVHADQTHGTLTSYTYCKCEKCKEAKNEYMRNYLPTYRALYGR